MPRDGKVDKWSRGDASALGSRMHALYAAEVTMTDRWLGFFLDHLHDLGLERDTAIVLVGDHGFMFGEYGYTGKISSELHPVLMRVPLVVVDPARRRAGRASDYLAQTHDVAPTLLSLAGVRAPRDMTGHDLSPLFERRRPRARKLAYGGYANSMYVRTRRWKLITDNRGQHKRLYDLAHDPDETHNVAHRHPARAAAMYDAVVPTPASSCNRAVCPRHGGPRRRTSRRRGPDDGGRRCGSRRDRAPGRRGACAGRGCP